MSTTTASLRRAFSVALKGERAALGVSQRELGRRTGIDNTLLCHFEAGRRLPTVEDLVTLADAFTTTTDELLGRPRA